MNKILKILIISIVLLNFILIGVYASGYNTSAYKPDTNWNTDIAGIGGRIIYVFQRIGTYFSVGILAYIGIQYMIASPSEKADIKGRAVPYIVSAVMIFGIVNILQIVYNILNN